MTNEYLEEIQETLARKITMSEVMGGMTSSDKKFVDLYNYAIDLQDKVNQLETNRDVVFTKEEVEKLLKQVQELDKFDTALESGLMLRRKHLENEILKKKIAQLETNRDEAIGYIKYCQVSDKDIFPVIEAEKMIEILERGKEC